MCIGQESIIYIFIYICGQAGGERDRWILCTFHSDPPINEHYISGCNCLTESRGHPATRQLPIFTGTRKENRHCLINGLLRDDLLTVFLRSYKNLAK